MLADVGGGPLGNKLVHPVAVVGDVPGYLLGSIDEKKRDEYRPPEFERLALLLQIFSFSCRVDEQAEFLVKDRP